MKTKYCPCKSSKAYNVCCGRYHQGNLQAPTAEALMRSRYSAYVLNKPQYIYRTWDKDTRPTLNDLRQESNQVFTHLEIVSTSNGGINDEIGTVEFIASYSIKSQTDSDTQQHQENSYFVKTKGRWVYVSEVKK